MLCGLVFFLLCAIGCNSQHSLSLHHHEVANSTLSGYDRGCRHTTPYYVTKNLKFNMCIGQTDQDLKNGMSIINLIRSRGYLPTCRILHLMLWMASEVGDRHRLSRDFFIDVGANIGSCSVHIAALGFPVISAEPVQQHVDTIQGTMDINPSFHIDLQHIGISSVEKNIRANFGHGARNWGASEFHEVGANETFEAELELKTLDRMVGLRKVALVKIDCEGCEWEAIKGGRRTLRRIPMLKIELVQPSYTAGNETVHAKDILIHLNQSNFEIFYDHWNEQHLYFGKFGNKVLDIDYLFGSDKPSTTDDIRKALHDAARKILSEPIDVATFDHHQFLKRGTDVIVIERTLSHRMKKRFGILA